MPAFVLYFYDEFCFRAVEVSNIISNHKFPSEAGLMLPEEPEPKIRFHTCHCFPLRLGTFFHFSVEGRKVSHNFLLSNI